MPADAVYEALRDAVCRRLGRPRSFFTPRRFRLMRCGTPKCRSAAGRLGRARRQGRRPEAAIAARQGQVMAELTGHDPVGSARPGRQGCYPAASPRSRPSPSGEERHVADDRRAGLPRRPAGPRPPRAGAGRGSTRGARLLRQGLGKLRPARAAGNALAHARAPPVSARRRAPAAASGSRPTSRRWKKTRSATAGDYPLYLRKQQLERVAAEYARAGLWADALAALGRFVDAPAYSGGDPPVDDALVRLLAPARGQPGQGAVSRLCTTGRCRPKTAESCGS